MWAYIALINTKIANANMRTTPILNSILVLCNDKIDDDSESDGSRHPPCVSSAQPDTNRRHNASKE